MAQTTATPTHLRVVGRGFTLTPIPAGQIPRYDVRDDATGDTFIFVGAAGRPPTAAELAEALADAGRLCDHAQLDTTDDAFICAAPGCGHRIARPAIDRDPQALATLAGRIGQIIAICEAA